MKEEHYQALLRVYEDVSEQLEGGAPGAMWVVPLGSLREIVAKHMQLEALAEDVRELVLDPGLSDTEIVVITPGHAGVLGRGAADE